MLVFQGAASFEQWTGRTAPVDVMLAAAGAAMDRIEAAVRGS
jgi:shikimate 5-dehydrogenase